MALSRNRWTVGGNFTWRFHRKPDDRQAGRQTVRQTTATMRIQKDEKGSVFIPSLALMMMSGWKTPHDEESGVKG